MCFFLSINVGSGDLELPNALLFLINAYALFSLNYSFPGDFNI